MPNDWLMYRGWVNMMKPIIVRAGDAFIAGPEPAGQRPQPNRDRELTVEFIAKEREAMGAGECSSLPPSLEPTRFYSKLAELIGTEPGASPIPPPA